MTIEHKGEMLKNEHKGEMLKPKVQEGDLLKSEGEKGNPLWKDTILNEEKKKKKKLNEMRAKLICLLLLFILFFSCAPKFRNKIDDNLYFHVNGYIKIREGVKVKLDEDQLIKIKPTIDDIVITYTWRF